ncbi:MAG: urease accessory UreF family protein [Roseibium sp.]|uniref:urease accessory protein UreF n=1 Tax=Roseibium sp. TaxID=1936156 RepID=UPI003D9C163A
MTSPLTLLRLLQCNDSSFPSGAFAFSSGLETLVQEKRVSGRADLERIIATQILPRWLAFDRFFLNQAFDSASSCADTSPEDWKTLSAVDAECHIHNTIDALAVASRRIGRSLLNVHARIGTPGATGYKDYIIAEAAGHSAGYEPVVLGLISSALQFDRCHAEAVALNNCLLGVTSAAIRLGQIGAIEAQALLAEVSGLAAEALTQPAPAFPSSFSPLGDIAIMRKAQSGANLFAT